MSTIPQRPNWVQVLSPSPKRLAQRLIVKHKFTSGLDIGCGSTSLLTCLRSPSFTTTGIDAFPEAVEESRRRDLHDNYIIGDFRHHDFPKHYDVIVMSHVIEHFSRHDGVRVLQRLEELAPRMIYVETPNGTLEQVARDNNPYQRHLSGWFKEDFIVRGYTVFGAGIKGLTGPEGKSTILPATATQFLNRTAQLLLLRRPELASTISAIKFIDALGNVRSL